MRINKSILSLSALIIINFILLGYAIYYFAWFNLNAPDEVLKKYINSIRMGEGQLTVRLINKFDWLSIDEVRRMGYEDILRDIDKVKTRERIGKININGKITRNGTIQYDISAEINRTARRGRIVLKKNKDEEWRVLHDDLLIDI